MSYSKFIAGKLSRFSAAGFEPVRYVRGCQLIPPQSRGDGDEK